MRAPRNSVSAQLVALAWARGYITAASVAALLGKPVNQASPYVRRAERLGYIEQMPGNRPMRWTLTRERLEAIDSMPDLQALRTQAEQLAQINDRVHAHLRKVASDAAAQRRAERSARTAAARQARKAAKATPGPSPKAAKVLAQPTGRQRPPALPGSRLVVPEKAGKPAGVKTGTAGPFHRDAVVQDPKGLLTPRPEAPAAPKPILLRGGYLAPNDGPYIRPGSLR